MADNGDRSDSAWREITVARRPLLPQVGRCRTHGYDAGVPKLEVAADQIWLDHLGVLPKTEEVSGDEYVREVRVSSADAEEVQLTWDVTDDSVRVRHYRDGRIVCDLFREMATLLTVAGTESATEVLIEYGSDGWFGRARVQVLPVVLIEDKLLRS